MTVTSPIGAMVVHKFSSRVLSFGTAPNARLLSTVVRGVRRNTGQTTKYFVMQLQTCQIGRNHDDLDPKSAIFVSHLTPQQQATVVGLVGNKCTVKGTINNCQVDFLWDTGAQVSIVSEAFSKRNFPGVTVKDIEKLLGAKLNLTAANGSDILYKGWVELKFKLLSSSNDLIVPFLVTEEALDVR